MKCPIFATLVAAQKIWNETEALVEEFASNISSFKKGSTSVFKTKWNDGAGSYYCNLLLKITNEGSKKPRQRWLTLQFDLARPLSKKAKTLKWTHAQEALLTVCFDPRLSGLSWGDESLASSEGSLLSAEAWSGCKKHKFADGRLLEWEEYSVGKKWSERAWIFAVPLYGIHSPADLKSQVIAPVVDLLVGNNCRGLEKTKAVIWAS